MVRKVLPEIEKSALQADQIDIAMLGKVWYALKNTELILTVGMIDQESDCRLVWGRCPASHETISIYSVSTHLVLPTSGMQHEIVNDIA